MELHSFRKIQLTLSRRADCDTRANIRPALYPKFRCLTEYKVRDLIAVDLLINADRIEVVFREDVVLVEGALRTRGTYRQQRRNSARTEPNLSTKYDLRGDKSTPCRSLSSSGKVISK